MPQPCPPVCLYTALSHEKQQLTSFAYGSVCVAIVKHVFCLLPHNLTCQALVSVLQLTTGITLGIEFGKYGTEPLPKAVSGGILAVICIFISGFAVS